jgi:hypothetical protein
MRRLAMLDAVIVIVLCLWVVPGIDLVVSAFETETQAFIGWLDNDCVAPNPGVVCTQGNNCPLGCTGDAFSCQSDPNANCPTGFLGCAVAIPGGFCLCNAFSC